MKSVLANVITRTASVSKIKLSTIWVVIQSKSSDPFKTIRLKVSRSLTRSKLSSAQSTTATKKSLTLHQTQRKYVFITIQPEETLSSFILILLTSTTLRRSNRTASISSKVTKEAERKKLKNKNSAFRSWIVRRDSLVIGSSCQLKILTRELCILKKHLLNSMAH